MTRFLTLADVWNYLDQIPMFSKVGASASNFGLDNISRFCKEIGNPHKQFKSIHVAGTNGKGTVTLLLESVYRNAGLKTGAFTSPHLLKYNERIKINGVDISDEKLLQFFHQTESVLNEVPLTYFEISTALAFWAFCEAKVDIAIIEAGLGGRLDSTNIITPECSVITSIGLDHQAILGTTKREIAREKAGIIKYNIPVVIGHIEPEEREEIEKKAELENASLVYSDNLFPVWEGDSVKINEVQNPIRTNFIEPVNKYNIAIIWSTIKILHSTIAVSESVLISSLEHFNGLPARFEKVHSQREWYFSGAHNPDAIQSMMEALNPLEGRKITCVLSLMKDKIGEETMNILKHFDRIYFYEQEGERAAKIEDVENYFIVKLIEEKNYKTILDELKHEVVIFAGSFYFYPIVKRWLTYTN